MESRQSEAYLVIASPCLPSQAPQSVGLSNGDKPIESNSDKVEVVVKVKDGNLDDDNHAISFFGALKLPVIFILHYLLSN